MPLRDTLLVLIVFGSVPFILKHSYIGILMWSWVSYMNPHRLTWSFAYNMPFAQTVALAFFASLVFNREPKKLPPSPLIKLWVALIVWMFITTQYAFWEKDAWEGFVQIFKIQLILFFTMAMMQSKERINLMIWVMFFSVGFFGIKGGWFTVTHGGGARVWGPEGSFIEDNNHLATALLMVVPLGYYLMTDQAKQTWVKVLIGVSMVLIMFSVVGSYSRGALIAIVAVTGYLWWKSSNKVLTGVSVLPLLPLLFLFMPDSWHERMGSISDYDTDDSVQGRFNAWWYSYHLANDRLTGGGIDNVSTMTFARYAPNPDDVHAAHSIYFGILGDHGWPGLLMFLAIFFWAWLIAARVIRAARGDPEHQWAAHLMQMVQVSLVAYATGGAFLSLMYFDLPWHLVALVVLVEHYLREQGVPLKEKRSRPQFGPATQPVRPARGGTGVP